MWQNKIFNIYGWKSVFENGILEEKTTILKKMILGVLCEPQLIENEQTTKLWSNSAAENSGIVTGISGFELSNFHVTAFLSETKHPTKLISTPCSTLWKYQYLDVVDTTWDLPRIIAEVYTAIIRIDFTLHFGFTILSTPDNNVLSPMEKMRDMSCC